MLSCKNILYCTVFYFAMVFYRANHGIAQPKGMIRTARIQNVVRTVTLSIFGLVFIAPDFASCQESPYSKPKPLVIKEGFQSTGRF